MILRRKSIYGELMLKLNDKLFMFVSRKSERRKRKLNGNKNVSERKKMLIVMLLER